MAHPVLDLAFAYYFGTVVYGLHHTRILAAVLYIYIFSVGESAGNGESLHRKRNLEAQLHTGVTLGYAGHSEIGEGVLGIVIEAHHVGLVVDLGPEGGGAQLQPAGVELIGHVGRNGLAGGEAVRIQVSQGGVASPGRDIGLVEGRRIGDEGGGSVEAVAALEHILQGELALERHKAVHRRLALGIVREETLAYQTLPPEALIGDVPGEIGLEAAPGQGQIGPATGLAHLREIIVAVLVAHLYLLRLAVLEIVVEVVLHLFRIYGEVPLGEGVYVQIVLAAQQVLHHLVVLSAVESAVEAAGKGEEVALTPLHVEREVQVVLVHAPLLESIFGTSALAVVIHVVETIPVDMAVIVIRTARSGPHIIGVVVLVLVQAAEVLIVQPGVARQVAVVVRTRIRSVVPVEGGIAVETGTPEQGCAGLEVLERIDRIFEHSHRFEGPADTGVAHLAVLIAPVAVVHIVAHQVIYLLRRGVLGAPLSRCREADETQTVHIAEFLFDAGVVGEVTVIYAFHPVVAAETGTDIEGIRPAVVQLARGVCGHKAETVER